MNIEENELNNILKYLFNFLIEYDNYYGRFNLNRKFN